MMQLVRCTAIKKRFTRKAPIAAPRSVGSNTSAMIAWTEAMVDPTRRPSMARSTIRVVTSRAKMQAVVNASYASSDPFSTASRPYRSESGPQTSCPTATAKDEECSQSMQWS